MAKGGLGRGLDSVFGEAEKLQEESTIRPGTTGDGIVSVKIEDLKPNPFQPRHEFRDEDLKELADSILEHGVIQPIIVEAADDGGFFIIAGERRTRASKLAGLKEIPAIVKSFSDERKLEIALIENIQRADLNPVEEALAYKQIMDMEGLSQDEVASRVGKKRSTVANSLRLLKLPEDMQGSLSSGQITPGHARAILSVVNPSDQRILFGRIIGTEMSVRAAEDAASELNNGMRNRNSTKKTKISRQKDPDICSIEQKFIDIFGTKVVIKGNLNKGTIEIEYFSEDDLDRIYKILDNNNPET